MEESCAFCIVLSLFFYARGDWGTAVWLWGWPLILYCWIKNNDNDAEEGGKP